MSKLEFKLPDIGEGVSEGEIVSWLVRSGDDVNEDQDMVEVMTDKATVTIGAPASGRIVEVVAAEGETVPVGSVIVVIDAGAAASGSDSTGSTEQAEATGTAASAVGDIKETLPGTAVAAPAPPPAVVAAAPAAERDAYFNEKPLAAPATRKLARELGVDLRRVAPSGEHGRVSREDVESFARAGGGAAGGNGTPAASRPVALQPVQRPPTAPIAPGPTEERVPIRGLRKRIYENMARSKGTAAHFTYVEECECTRLIAMRDRLKPVAEQQGVNLSFLPFVVKATVAALRRHPQLNALVDDSSMEMVRRNNFDIGMAAATDAGLMVPVLRDADKLSIVDIAREIVRLATDARSGKTPREDLGGSSFTITSLGKLGGVMATPVVNYPEVAILFVSEMKKKPVVRGDEIVVGHLMNISLSFDHRIIDGHVGAAFAKDVVTLLEEPERLLLEM